MEQLSSLIIPAIIALAGVIMLASKHDYFADFCNGARYGLKSCIGLVPSLCAILVALKMFSASGALEAVTRLLSPIGERIGLPVELFPLLVTRPISGAASNGTFVSLMSTLGADSFPALCAAVIMGSSDTMIYVTAIYFSSAGVKRSRHALPVAAAVMLFCVFFSCFLCRLFFT